jgi:hypothetical protein
MIGEAGLRVVSDLKKDQLAKMYVVRADRTSGLRLPDAGGSSPDDAGIAIAQVPDK